MRLLIDSHVLLWTLYLPVKIGPQARDALSAADSVAISMASLWELALKFTKGRLQHSPAALAMGVGTLGLDELGVGHRHLLKIAELQLPHSDPFDVMLIAQAEADGLTLVTADRALLASPYSTLNARL